MRKVDLIIVLMLAVTLVGVLIFGQHRDDDSKNIQQIAGYINTQDLTTLEDCVTQSKLVETRRWELIKDKWLKISDINDAVWYYSKEVPIRIKRESWNKLIEEKSQEAPKFIYFGDSITQDVTTVEISYQVSKEDIVRALAQTVDVNDTKDKNEQDNSEH